MSTDLHDTKAHKLNWGLYAAIVIGLAVVAGLAAWSFNAGGLPGTTNSPSAVVHGQPTVGKTGAD